MSKLFRLNTLELKKAGIKFILVILGFIATFLQVDFFNVVELPSWILPIMVAVNTGLADLIRKFIQDEEGKYLGGLFNNKE